MKKLIFILLLLASSSTRFQARQANNWTAKVLEGHLVGDQIQIAVEYDNNGLAVITQYYRFDGSSDINAGLQTLVSNKLTQLNLITSYVVNIGTVTPTVVTPPVVTPPDPIADRLSTEIALLNSAKRAVDLGVITILSTEYIAAKNAVLTDYQSKYLNLF